MLRFYTFKISAEYLIWQSDWNGDEVGYPDIPVVGLYQMKESSIQFYINTETNEIIEIIPPYCEES